MQQNQSLIIASVQMNATVGAIADNTERVISWCRQASESKVDLVLFPELVLTGYPPEDLLFRQDLYVQLEQAKQQICQSLPEDMVAVIGLPRKKGDKLYNAAWITGSGFDQYYHKQKLPNYGVFDEKRYFCKGKKSQCIQLKGKNLLLSLCEDIWFSSTIKKAKKHHDSIDIIVNINASPYQIDKHRQRLAMLTKRAQQANAAIFYCNLVGGQDELVFDGDSMVVNAAGQLVQQACLLQETMAITKVEPSGALVPLTASPKPLKEIEQIYHALVLSVRDYVYKNGFNGVVIALSGGIDSALTLAIAVDALGKDSVEVLFMPSRYTAKISGDDALEQAKKMGVVYRTLAIEPVFNAFLDTLAEDFKDYPVDATEENIQARCRGILTMAMANKKNKLVLTTGNKSEMSVGYATLYGDMAGGFAPLKDISKMRVYALANYRNSISPVIPQRVIARPPSAELAPGQKDEDSLPPYEILDEILYRFVELDQSRQEIIQQGFDAEVVNKVIRLTLLSEYKRRQAAPGVKITAKAFGRERRFPITSAYQPL